MTREEFEILASQHEATFSPDNCPEHLRAALERYAEHGIPPGDCLRAVLANDLQGAFARADVVTARAMPAIVSYVYNHLPHNSHGSYDIVDQYVTVVRYARRKEQP